MKDEGQKTGKRERELYSSLAAKVKRRKRIFCFFNSIQGNSQEELLATSVLVSNPSHYFSFFVFSTLLFSSATHFLLIEHLFFHFFLTFFFLLPRSLLNRSDTNSLFFTLFFSLQLFDAASST